MRENDVQGIKKLAEILDAYLVLAVTAMDAEERAIIVGRAARLAAQTDTEEYHTLAISSRADLQGNAMSYFRVAWVMDRLGLDTSGYRRRLKSLKPRMDELLAQHPDYKLEMFTRFYDHFAMAKPAALRRTYSQGVIERRAPLTAYDDAKVGYELTHLVFYAYDYGYQPTQTRFEAGDLDYVVQTVPELIRESIRVNYPDLLAELLSCMTYVGRKDHAVAQQATDYLLTHQNANGTWGSYEVLRPRYGAYLEHQWYLHTTLVSLRSLAEIFEGDWPSGS